MVAIGAFYTHDGGDFANSGDLEPAAVRGTESAAKLPLKLSDSNGAVRCNLPTISARKSFLIDDLLRLRSTGLRDILLRVSV